MAQEQTTGKNRKSYSFVKQQARRDKRRQEAEARDRHYQSLSTADKLKLAQSRPGESKREVARLTKRLEWEKAQKVTAAAQAKAAKPAPLTEAQKADKAMKRAKAAAAHANQ